MILPITFKADDPQAVVDYCERLAAELRSLSYAGRPIEVEIDHRDMRGGDKVWSWIKKGVPIRLEVGPRDMANDAVFMARRDLGHKEKASVPRAEFVAKAASILEEMQTGMLERARKLRDENLQVIDDRASFEAFFAAPDSGDGPTPIHGGFALAHWSGDPEVEARINAELGVTIRCVPLEPVAGADDSGTCPFSGEPSERRVVWAKAY